MSSEHIVSKSLFKSRVVTVRGFHWCTDEAVQIGVRSLTKNVLCRKHNSMLSPVDAAGAHAFNVLRDQTKLAKQRHKSQAHELPTVDFNIDATILERWLLKTLINIECGGRFRIGPESNLDGYPSDDLVQVAFGLKQFPPENGLSIATKIGMKLHMSEMLRVTALAKRRKYIDGGMFIFHGIYMFLDLIRGGLTVPFVQISRTQPDWHHLELTKRLRRIRVTINQRTSHIIHFNWH